MKSFVCSAAFAATLFGAGATFAVENTVTLKIEGMTCASCPYLVKKSLTRLEGVKEAKVTLETASAIVTFDDQKITPKALTNATLAAGFPSSVTSK